MGARLHRPSVLLAAGAVAAACTTFGSADDSAGPASPDAAADGAVDAIADASGGGQDGADSAADAAADVDAASCPGAAGCERVVFVTSKVHNVGSSGGGAFSSVAEADQLCNDAATSATSARVQGHVFVAWLGDGTVSAASRVVHGLKPYVDVNGTPVAANFTALTTGGASQPIELDETSMMVSGRTWTGASSDGTIPPGDAGATSCASWSSAAASAEAVAGTTTLAGPSWTDTAPPLTCATGAHLYCFEK